MTRSQARANKTREEGPYFSRLRKLCTCACLPFSRASLVGREEYTVEDSPSFLGSTGLFGLRGKPVAKQLIRSTFLFKTINLRKMNSKIQAHLYQRSTSAVGFFVSCRRTPSRTPPALRCTAPRRCQGAAQPAGDTANPDLPEGSKDRETERKQKTINIGFSIATKEKKVSIINSHNEPHLSAF